MSEWHIHNNNLPVAYLGYHSHVNKFNCDLTEKEVHVYTPTCIIIVTENLYPLKYLKGHYPYLKPVGMLYSEFNLW